MRIRLKLLNQPPHGNIFVRLGKILFKKKCYFHKDTRFAQLILGVLLASQRIEVPVMKKPVVCIIPTGDELVFPDGETPPGKLVEFNGTVMANYVPEWGGEPHLHSRL